MEPVLAWICSPLVGMALSAKELVLADVSIAVELVDVVDTEEVPRDPEAAVVVETVTVGMLGPVLLIGVVITTNKNKNNF